MNASHRGLKVFIAGFIVFSNSRVRAAIACPAAAGVQYVTTVEGISEYRLQNGLGFCSFPIHKDQHHREYHLYGRVAPRGLRETGMAHLLEHLMFMGSKNHTDIKRSFRITGLNQTLHLF